MCVCVCASVCVYFDAVGVITHEVVDTEIRGESHYIWLALCMTVVLILTITSAALWQRVT